MAKQKSNIFDFSKIGALIDKSISNLPIEIDRGSGTKEFISTGILILDAALSGSILNGGIQANRITAFAGESGVGKSFLAYGVCRSAQKKGYYIVYIDTEFAIEPEDMATYGVDSDPSKFKLLRSNKVEDLSIMLAQTLDGLKAAKREGMEIAPVLFVLDSVGMMSSNKEQTDLVEGKMKQDMTRAKALGALFRTVSSDLGYLKIPMVVTNHTYKSLDMFPQEIMKGGNALRYSASSIIYLSKAKLKTGEEDENDLGASGIVVTAKGVKNRLAKPKQVKFPISFETATNPYQGLEMFCTEEFFSTVGIAKGKMDVDKSTGELLFKAGGNKYYVKHLDKSFFLKQLFKRSIFTDAVLTEMEVHVKQYFKYKSLEEMDTLNAAFEEVNEEISEENEYGVEEADLDASNLFS